MLFCDPMNFSTSGSLSFTIFLSLLKPMSAEPVMPSNHLVLCCSILFLPSIFPSIKVFSKWVSYSHRVAKVLELWLQYQSFQWILKTDFLYDWLVWYPCSSRNSQESSPTPQLESIASLVLSLLMIQLLHPYKTTGKTIAFTRHTFLCKVMSLLFNIPSRFVEVFLPGSKRL